MTRRQVVNNILYTHYKIDKIDTLQNLVHHINKNNLQRIRETINEIYLLNDDANNKQLLLSIMSAYKHYNSNTDQSNNLNQIIHNVTMLKKNELAILSNYFKTREKLRIENNGEFFISLFLSITFLTLYFLSLGKISFLLKEKEKRIKLYEKSNKELESFAYVASHDLKAPLRAIECLITWIEEDNKNVFSEDSTKNFLLIKNRSKRMSNLIEGILQYSRIGRIQMDVIKINVKELLKEVIDNLNPPETFEIRYPDTMPIIQGYKVFLEQVFTNLISNAIKFNHRIDGMIKIGFHESDEFVEFFVQDNGPGIESQYHTKIFEVFQTLQSRDIIESTGIGLSIVKKIIESQGGAINVNSELDQGTIFYFTYPKSILLLKESDQTQTEMEATPC